MTKKIIHAAVLFVLLVAGLFGTARTVSADGTYPTERINLNPVGGAPLRSGAVVNIHANGPNIYAREVYTLNGAMPNTDYQVVLNGYLGDTNCTSAPLLVVKTAVISTNVSGNGRAAALFTPEAVAGLNGLTVEVQWQVWNGAALAYQTECVTVTLD